MSAEAVDAVIASLGESGANSAELRAALAKLRIAPAGECADRLRSWVRRWGDGPCPSLREMLAAVAECPDPPLALLNWERWLETHDDPWSGIGSATQSRTLTALFSQSQFLADALIGDPALRPLIADEGFLHQPWSRAHLREELCRVVGEAAAEDRRRAVSQWRRRHLLRIGLLDILDRALVERLTRELSDVASAVVQACLDHIWEELVARWGEPQSEGGDPVGFAVLGMGKLGGRELNFSSDIDLVFIYSEEGETAGRGSGREGRVPNHRFMRRVGERLVEEIGAVGPEGRLYRVDLRLRPEGGAGPIARSLESLQVYFDAQARLWERFAHTKARVVAHRGPQAFVDEVEQVVQRFCYGQAPGPELPRELASLKHRIDLEITLTGQEGTEVKRGLGGIREIEFVVGLFQLVHGHHHPELRTRGLLETLRGLEVRRILTAAATRRLRRAYETLRRVEHRLQMMHELQTHALPTEPRALERLARRLGWEGAEGAGIRRRFLAELGQINSMVHQAFLQHIGAPEVAGIATDVAIVLEESTPTDQAAQILARFGLRNPEAAVGVVRGLGRGGPGAYVDAPAQRAFERLLPSLLAWCPQVPSADLALRRLAGFVEAYKARGVLYTIMADEPQLVEVLMRLFGASELLGQLLANHPEYFDSVVARALGLTLPSEALQEMWTILQPRESADTDRLLDTLRTLRHMFRLAISLRHLLGLDPWVDFAAHLTGLAEFCLARAWRAIIDEGSTSPQPVACIAVGKFGGREINIESDLDVVFVCHPPDELEEPDALEWLHARTRRCERLLAAAKEVTRRAALWELDTRLRPEGRNAPLLCTDRRLVSYFAADAQLWEFQTFLRARPVAGDLSLGLRVVAEIHAAMRERLRTLDLPAEILAMRRRLEKNADHPGGEKAVDLKRDPGGIVDIEFLVQRAQLERLRDEGAAPEVNTAEALASLPQLVEENRIALRRHLLTLRTVECQLRLLQASRSSAIPADPERWRQLAVAHLGPRADAEELRTHLEAVRKSTWAHFEHTMSV